MFECATYFKFLIGICLIFFTYQHIVALHRTSYVSAIDESLGKAQIIAALSAPADIFNCKTSTVPATLFNQQDFCQGVAYEIYSFPRCDYTRACPGWNYVVFNENGRAIAESTWVAPLFPGGPAL